MTRILFYTYFLLAIAVFEAIIGLSLQSLGALIAYNLLLLAASIAAGLVYSTRYSGRARVAGLLLLAVSAVKAASLVYDLPVVADAVVDMVLVIVLVSSVALLRGGRVALLAVVFAVTGSVLVFLKLDPYTLVGGLILEAGAAFLAAGHLRPVNSG
ncbi:MAG: hypothetical protein F7C38_02235 [Desulfurococcales archaeon]|nr:hypothetical protein [Desulfurococcales archaeon]